MLNDLNNLTNEESQPQNASKYWQKGYDMAVNNERDRTIPYSKGEYEHQPQHFKEFALGYNEGLKDRK